MRVVMTFLVVAVFVLPACKKTKTEQAPTTGSDTGSATMAAGSGSALGSGSDATGSGVAAATGSGSDTVITAGSGQLTEAGSNVDPTAMSHRASHCPSTVPGSTTKSELKGRSVFVTVTGHDKDAIAAIKARADELLKDKAVAKLAGDEPTPGHDQKGTHGGGVGICPVCVS
jgi:hypothetical protein